MAAGTRALERLEFIVSMRDLVGERLAGLQRRLTAFSRGVERGSLQIKSAFIGATAGVLGLVGALGPAIEHEQALREVASLGVSTENLRLLSESAMKYSGEFGESATAFVRSAYDIQSAISGLTGRELARFTTAANVTAKATQASAAEMTSFFGTMFGVFQEQADKMGRAEWVDLLAGRTAQTVNLFKTTGPQLAAFFENLGAEATKAGLTMQEQLAIGGRLQATMGGSQAGTVYRSFLQNVGRAQGELGLQFTDAQGRMLGVAEILEKIRARFGDIDTVAKSDLIKKAFGSDEAVKLVKLLIGNTGELRRNIESLGEVQGIAPALDAARAQVDPFARLNESIKNLVMTWGSFLIPIIQPYLDKLSAAAATTQRWAEQFPNITKLLGVAALALLGLVVGFALLQGALGVFSIVSAGLALLFSPIGLLILGLAALAALVVLAIRNWETWGPVLLAVAAALAIVLAIFFPIPLAIAAVVAAVAVAVVWWDQLKAAGVAALDALRSAWESGLAWIAAQWQGFTGLVRGAWDVAIGWVLDKWNAFTAAIRTGVETITGFFERLTAPGTLLGSVAGFLGIAPDPEGAGALARRGVQAETIGGEARQAISNVANPDQRRQQTNIVNIKTEKMDIGAFERALNLAAQG